MPPSRPPTSGYERLAQADALSGDESDDDILTRSYASVHPAPAPRFNTAQPQQRPGMGSPRASYMASYGPYPSRSRPQQRRRLGSSSGVDLKAINSRLERWADEIAARFKRRRSDRLDDDEDDRIEIFYSVFQAPEGVRPATEESLASLPPPAMEKTEYEVIVESIRLAIEQGIHPRMISQGSSGSYFARDLDGTVVGIFKPKDEEPYAAGNPKWNKWIHRNLFPCFFGRACLIPNLSYVSEAAAYVLDCQLRTHIVPYTDVVSLSSKSFHYPFWERFSAFRKAKTLPAKPGSFQVFLKGFKDANIFLREHPWPEQYWSSFRGDPRQRHTKRWVNNRRPNSIATITDDPDGTEDSLLSDNPGLRPDEFVWTERLKQSFREELEKLVILDYIMRNTDRALDNWMIKVDWPSQQVSLISEPIQMNLRGNDEDTSLENGLQSTRTSSPLPTGAQRPTDASTSHLQDLPFKPTIAIGAIDNSLSWPWKHPDAWRSFPFGWLFLPVHLIGRPFSQKTRDHFLPLLTSTVWWTQTHTALKKVFMKDPDFKERMFARQMAVMKGQAWNVVETLKLADHGPLELTRRSKVCVWDDLVDVPLAMPMRQSSEFRHRQESGPSHPSEEVDIGMVSSPLVVAAHTVARHDIAGTATPPADMPHPGRFGERPLSPDGRLLGNGSTLLNKSADTAELPSVAGHSRKVRRSVSSQQAASGRSLSNHDLYQHQHSGQLRRNSAAAMHSGRSIVRQLHGPVALFDGFDHGDGLDGDLGYAAAEDMDRNQHKKVIVERLEAVKTKNPVFECC